MSFSELKIKKEYRSLKDDIVKEFFNPVFSKSVIYKRAVGYFSSSALMILSEGFTKGIFDLIKNLFSMQLIISPQLSRDDLEAIKDGFYHYGNINSEFNLYKGNFNKKRLNLLSNLIALGFLKIKIANIEKNNGLGRFNDKMGLFYDTEGNIIAFSGSMNESANGFTKNYDSIDVFTSFDDLDRVKAKETAFDSLWNNQESGVNVTKFDFSKIKVFDYDEMSKIKSSEDIFYDSYNEESHHAEYISSILEKTFENIYKAVNNHEKSFGITTGLMDLDRITNGLQKSDLIILAARPSMGKTALALNIATSAAKKDNVLFFSLEMNLNQLGKRILSSTSGVNLQSINTGNLYDDDMDSMINALEFQSNLNLFIDDTSSQTLNQIIRKSKSFKQEKGLGLIIIDYIQLIQGSNEYKGNRVQEMSEISRGLKILAKELDVPILAVSQLSRNVEQRADKKPQLSDLRESGSIEQDADIVMLLYRDEYYNRDEFDNKNIAELIIAKNRNGATTNLHFRFDKETMKFSDLTQEDLSK